MGLGNRPGFTAMTGAERSGDDARERIKRHQFSLRQPLKGNGLTAPDQQAQHEHEPCRSRVAQTATVHGAAVTQWLSGAWSLPPGPRAA